MWPQENHPLSWIDLRTCGNEPVTAISAMLQFQHRFFRSHTSWALFPPPCTLKGNEMFLDLLCGPGSWCLDISQKYPEAQVWGLDLHQGLLDLAQENAAHLSAGRLHFQLTDYADALPFPDETFDMIHLQNGAEFFPLHQWPSLMAEMVRVLKPGGWLSLIDVEMGVVSHPAIDRLLALRRQIMAIRNHGAVQHKAGPLTGGTPGPQRMAHYALTNIGYHLFPLNLGGWQNQMGRRYLIWCLARPELMLALIELAGISPMEEWQLVVRQAQWEVQLLDFCGVGMLLTAFGQKSVSRVLPSLLL